MDQLKSLFKPALILKKRNSSSVINASHVTHGNGYEDNARASGNSIIFIRY